MENNTYMIPPFGGKSILRSTGEQVEIIDSEIKERGARNDEDWVTYIDSKGEEHIKEKLNFQLDFKPANDMQSVFDRFMGDDWKKSMPSNMNARVYEVAKGAYVQQRTAYE